VTYARLIAKHCAYTAWNAAMDEVKAISTGSIRRPTLNVMVCRSLRWRIDYSEVGRRSFPAATLRSARKPCALA
jgi:hypothetical protein